MAFEGRDGKIFWRPNIVCRHREMNVEPLCYGSLRDVEAMGVKEMRLIDDVEDFFLRHGPALSLFDAIGTQCGRRVSIGNR